MPFAATAGFAEIAALVATGAVTAEGGVPSALVQPASLDLRLSAEAYRMPASILSLPGERMRDLINGFALERVDLSQPRILARGLVHWVRLREAVQLPRGVEVYTNSKSSTGRLDLATRVLVDGSPRYDRIPAGFSGELWCELIPRSFDVVVRTGDSLNQAIFFSERQVLDQRELRREHAVCPLLVDDAGSGIAAESCLRDGRVVMGADLQAPTVGWVARRSRKPVDLAAIGRHRAEEYFTALPRPDGGLLFLERDRFYILATLERVVVPAHLACEMVPYDPSAGEFRAHYAGFFDPGFGIRGGKPTGCRAVLEVRPHEDDLVLRHGQPICAMAYERLSAPATRLYGETGSSYADQQGPRLSKHFG